MGFLKKINPLTDLYDRYGLAVKLRMDLNLIVTSVAFGNILF